MLKIPYLHTKDIDYKFFLIGIFLLATAPFLGTIFLIFSLFLGLKESRNAILLDRYNYPLIVASLLMIIKCFVSYFFQSSNLALWDQSLNWIGLINWIPLFIFFIGFQQYVSTEKQRVLISKVLIASSIPVLLAGLFQYYLKIYGPFQFLNGLIIWYQKPLMSGGGITSIFNNPNIAGAWLTLVWPLCLSIFLINRRNILKSFIVLFIISLFTLCIILTVSRGAWVGLTIAIPIIFGSVSLNLLVPFLTILIILILIPFISIIPNFVKDFTPLIIPEHISIKFTELILNFHEFPRLDIWINSLIFIVRKPIFGWGAGTFPILYEEASGFYNNHAHNLFLELAINYGLINAILIFLFLSTLIINSYKNIFNTKTSIISINDKAWWCSSVIFIISQMYDISSYDLRISITSWLFFSGLREIIRGNK